MIKIIFLYSILTNTDIICIFSIFICKQKSCAPDSAFRDVLVEVIIKSDVLHRFDTSHKFGRDMESKMKIWKPKLGYFSIENIDDHCVVTAALIPKEYFEEFESQSVKKTKEAKKRCEWNGIWRLREKDKFHRGNWNFWAAIKTKYKQIRFTIKSNEMVLEDVESSNLHK